jgi:C4-dicarboxylate-specific signal transduction histidine kinase
MILRKDGSDMCGRECLCEQLTDVDAIEQMSTALHSLCQPLTTLQCRLEMAELVGTMDGYREAVTHALAECTRLVDGVGSMREILRAARPADGARARTALKVT